MGFSRARVRSNDEGQLKQSVVVMGCMEVEAATRRSGGGPADVPSSEAQHPVSAALKASDAFQSHITPASSCSAVTAAVELCVSCSAHARQ